MAAVNLASDGVLQLVAAGTHAVGAAGDGSMSSGRVVAGTGEEFTGVWCRSDTTDACGVDDANDGNTISVGDAECVDTCVAGRGHVACVSIGAVGKVDAVCVDTDAVVRGDVACVDANALGSVIFGEMDLLISRLRIAKQIRRCSGCRVCA